MKTRYLLIFFFINLAAFAQPTKDIYLKSIKAYRHKDYVAFLELTKQLDSIRPSHPTYTLNLASAYALNNLPGKALVSLEKSIEMDNSVDFEKEADFDSLRKLPDYQKLINLKSSQGKIVSTSVKKVSLNEKDLHPEGLLYLEKSKTWLATSIHKGKIISFNMRTGKCTDWINDKIFSAFAMKTDAAEKYLWVATAAIPEMSGYTKDMEGKAEILKIDIRAKKIIQRFSVLGKHIFGDLLVAKNGIVYVSDSLTPVVYKIENDEMVNWLMLNDKIYNLQGMAFNADESKMYLADYFSGILEIPMGNMAGKHWLAFPKGTVEKGIDGLSWYDKSLVAIQNGVKPIRIVQYFLDYSGSNITSFRIIDNNRAEFNEPASGCIKDGQFYFFANNPWNAYDKTFNLDESKMENPMVFSFGLKYAILLR